jgi:hypothetical protein
MIQLKGCSVTEMGYAGKASTSTLGTIDIETQTQSQKITTAIVVAAIIGIFGLFIFGTTRSKYA